MIAALLCMDGLTSEEAFDKISAARGRDVPDTKDQALWLKQVFSR